MRASRQYLLLVHRTLNNHIIHFFFTAMNRTYKKKNRRLFLREYQGPDAPDCQTVF